MYHWLRWVSILTVLARFVLAALLPLAITLPVHAIGRMRRARGAPQVDARWTHRHAWLAWQLMLFGPLLALGAFGYEELEAIIFRRPEEDLTQLQLARAGVSSAIAVSLAAAAFTRKSDWKNVTPAAWLNIPTLQRAGKYFVVLLGLALINRVLLALLEAFVPLADDVDTSTLDALRAIRDVYGVPAMMCVAAISAPIAEEFIFRGVVLDAFSRDLPWRWANFLQSVLFALLHSEVKMAPTLIAFGVIAGMLRRQTKSLATGMVFHAINNTVALIATR